jgi:hypothetical protein
LGWREWSWEVGEGGVEKFRFVYVRMSDNANIGVGDNARVQTSCLELESLKGLDCALIQTVQTSPFEALIAPLVIQCSHVANTITK